MAATVLVVEDELKLRELLRAHLERDGLEVLSTGFGAEGLALASMAEPDLIVLDLSLPDVPGEEVASELRASGNDVPILVLTPETDEGHPIPTLDLGADDYLAKPFSPRELVLRAQAILRSGRHAVARFGPLSLGGGELVLDEQRREAQVRGAQVALTPTEWGILMALSRNPGRVYSRYELINRVRGYEFGGYERTINSHVKNLRRKIEVDPRSPRLVHTVPGDGYRLAVDRDD